MTFSVSKTQEKKKVLDLFSGTGGFSQAFRESDEYDVVEVDNNEAGDFDPDIEADIMQLSADELPDADIVLASPPCKSFSMGSIGHHWHKHTEEVRLPESETAYIGVQLVYKALWLIRQIEPDYWFLENPRAGLRKVLGNPQGTVSWCQYWTERDAKEKGVPVMKPTDLWGEHPEEFDYEFCGNGQDCHESSPRGSQTGTQGKDSAADRAAIPYGLSKAIKDAVEKEC